MTRLRTIWRFSSQTYDLACRIRQYADGRAAVTVTENGRLVDQRVFRGSHDQTLNQAWHEAVALHEKYRHRSSPRQTPRRRARDARDGDRLRLRLLPAIRRLERSRTDLLRVLDSLDSQGHQAVGAVKKFRSSWEALDLEHHFLTGKPLSVEHYRKRLRAAAGPGRRPSDSPVTAEQR